jgi:hypothetical protein
VPSDPGWTASTICSGLIAEGTGQEAIDHVRPGDRIRLSAAVTSDPFVPPEFGRNSQNDSAKKRSFVAAAFCECFMNFNLMVSMDREPRTVSLAFGVLVKFIMELSNIGVDAVQ